MKAVILAGGLGSRISEESVARPKPMIEIGGKPILWHIMKIYSQYGVNDFVICTGYKSYMIKEYFLNYFYHNADVTFDLSKNNVTVHQTNSESWKVTVVDTGEASMTGGRLKRVHNYIKDEESFHFTYGDGVADVDITALEKFHKQHGKLSTITAVQPPGRFGMVDMEGDKVKRFLEKPKGDGGFINGGFFVLSPKVVEFIAEDSTIWEREPMETLAEKDQMRAFKHTGFWQPMDTLRDKNYLESLIADNEAPWMNWK